MKRLNYLLAALGGVLVVESVLTISSIRFDFATYYKAARAIGAGSDPYADFNFRQLPLWAWLLQPFGQLPFEWASLVWLGASMLALAASALLVFAALGQPLDRRRAVWLLAFLASPPVMLCLYHGQATPFILLGYSAGLFLAAHRRYALAGLLAAMAMIKPHLALVVLPLVLAMPFAAWGGFALGAALWFGFSALVGGPALMGGFAGRLLNLSAAPTFEERPTIFGLIGAYVPQPALVNAVLAAVLAVLLGWFAICRVAGRPFPLRAATLVPLSVLLLPYALVNDLVLLMPVYVATVAVGSLSLRWRLAGLATVWLVPFVTTLYLGPNGIMNSADALIPLVLMMATLRQNVTLGEGPSAGVAPAFASGRR